MRRGWRAALIAGYAALLLLFVLGTLEREPYDDAYFFKRFALNLLDHGVLAWNVDEGPVYGSTSQLFQALVVAITALGGDSSLLVGRLLLALCLLAGFVLMLDLTRNRDGGFCTLIAFCSPVLLYTAVSGMETALVIALLAGVLWLLYAERAERLAWWLAPLGALLVWLARPDALLLAGPLVLVQRWAWTRRAPLREAALLGGSICSCLLAFKLYYGTALPLPFYAKQIWFTPYDEAFLAISRQVQRVRFGLFCATALPLLAAAWLRLDRTNQLLLGCAVVFAGYHWLTTVEVMGMHGRFYAPALPLLAFAATRGCVSVLPRAWGVAARVAAIQLAAYALLAAAGWLPARSAASADGVPLAFHGASVLGMLALSAVLPAAHLRRWANWLVLGAAACAVMAAYPPRLRALPSDDRYLQLHARHVTVFRGLDTLLACFGDAIHVYHSEVGVPGLRLRHGKVTDLAGLLSPAWLFRGASFDDHCLADSPDAIFMPHKNYVRLNHEIAASRCLERYRVVVKKSSSPLYVRSDLYDRYERCAMDRR